MITLLVRWPFSERLSDKRGLTGVHIIFEVFNAFLEGFHYRDISTDNLSLPRKRQAP